MTESNTLITGSLDERGRPQIDMKVVGLSFLLKVVIDTGSDEFLCLPRAMLEAAGLQVDGAMVFRETAGDKEGAAETPFETCEVQIEFFGATRTLRALVTNKTYGLLGTAMMSDC